MVCDCGLVCGEECTRAERGGLDSGRFILNTEIRPKGLRINLSAETWPVGALLQKKERKKKNVSSVHRRLRTSYEHSAILSISPVPCLHLRITSIVSSGRINNIVGVVLVQTRGRSGSRVPR